MSLEDIEIEVSDRLISITNKSEVQLYSGDRGSTIWSTVRLTENELLEHIDNLVKILK